MLQRKMIGKFVCESFKRWDLSHGNALELNANDLGIFVDESGEQGTESKYYLMALVFRDQSKDISLRLTRYEQSCLLSSCGSPLWRVVSVRKSGGN